MFVFLQRSQCCFSVIKKRCLPVEQEHRLQIAIIIRCSMNGSPGLECCTTFKRVLQYCCTILESSLVGFCFFWDNFGNIFDSHTYPSCGHNNENLAHHLAYVSNPFPYSKWGYLHVHPSADYFALHAYINICIIYAHCTCTSTFTTQVSSVQ